MAKKFELRNSAAKFLIFQIEGEESGVQVVCHDETRARRSYITNGQPVQTFFVNLALNKKRLYYVGS